MAVDLLTSTFGIHFTVKRTKKRNGEVPVYVRITVDKRRIDLSAKCWIKDEEWNDGKGRAKPCSPTNRELNSYLDQMQANLIRKYQELSIRQEIITPEKIKNAYLGIDERRYSLVELFEYHNEVMDKTLRWGTMKNYHTTLRYVKEFLREVRKRSDIYLAELNFKFITDFEFFMRTTESFDPIKTIGNNTVMKHQERLRKVVRMAVRMEWIDKDPFKAYRLKFQKFDREFLKPQELERLKCSVLPSERLSYARDLFVFACYTGLSYIDVMSLKPSNIQQGFDGDFWIISQRQKTGTTIRIPLLSAAEKLIAGYRNHPKSLSGNVIFPALSNQKLNHALKEIAVRNSINKNLTFHMARHTFATTITLSNGVPIESVGKMLGHTKLSTTQIYARVLEVKLSQDMRNLKSKLG